MSWLQLKIQTTAEYAEIISNILTLFDAKAVTYLDAADQPILEPAPGTTPLWQQDWIVGLFEPTIAAEKIIAFLKAQYGDTVIQNYSIDLLENQNWERAWLDHFQPLSFGKHLWICPSAYTPPDPSAINIILDPGLAFGTGTHPTTALCLGWLDGHDLENKTVIDYGCGSGILAIAALKLGAKTAWAVDYDEQALLATQDNAKRNNIASENIHLLLPEALPAVKVDILLANILANPLIELAERFADLLKPDGKIVLSGILAEQVDSVINAYKKYFKLSPPKQKEEWILLEGSLTLSA